MGEITLCKPLAFQWLNLGKINPTLNKQDQKTNFWVPEQMYSKAPELPIWLLAQAAALSSLEQVTNFAWKQQDGAT